MDNVKGIVSIFNFIKEMNKLKYTSIADVRDQIWNCFTRDIPDDSSAVILFNWDNAQDTSNGEELVILKIKKPDLPTCPQPPKSINGWLEPGWDKHDVQAFYKKSLQVLGEELVELCFEDDEKRVQDFRQWAQKRAEWQKEYSKALIIRNLFAELYSRYIDLGKNPDTTELLCGSGLIKDKRNTRVYHPILLKRCQIKFEPADNIIKICDTDVEPQICTEVLSFIEEINTDKVGVYQNKLHEEQFHPFDKQNAVEFLREFTHDLCAESEFLDDDKTDCKDRIAVLYSPTFFIRKRIDGAVRATEKVIANIESTGEVPQHLLELAGATSKRIIPTDYEEPDMVRKLAALNGESPEILLSKEANREQLEIAERIEKEDAVIVQGPPGTGKTHTIANLIGHFLADGKSILVTSHTRKALTVLKEKLPKKLQGLCVSILEDSNRDMERSIDSITEYMSKFSSGEFKRKANSIFNERLDIIKRLSELRMKIYMEKRKECNPIVIDGESYSVSEAADFIRINSERWARYIPGDVSVNKSLPMTKSDLNFLYESNGILTPEVEKELRHSLPAPATLPTPERFDEEISRRKEYTAKLSRLSDELGIELTFDSADNCIVCDNHHIIKNPRSGALERLEQFTQQSPSFAGWQLNAAADGRQDNGARRLWENFASAIERFTNYEKCIMPDLIGKSVTLGQYENNLHQARSLLYDLRKNNGKISAFSRLFNKDLDTIYRSVRINGAQISSVTDCDIVLKTIELAQMRNELAIYWNKLMATNGCPEFNYLGSEASRFCAAKLPEIKKYINWYTTDYVVLRSLLADAGIDSALLFNLSGMESDLEMTQKIIDAVQKRLHAYIEAGRYLLHIIEIDRQIEKLQEKLSDGDRKESRVCRNLFKAVTQHSVSEYRTYYNDLTDIYDKYEVRERRKHLISLINDVTPDWAAAISRREGIHGGTKCPEDIFSAWKLKQFDSAIKLILQAPIEKQQEEADMLRKILSEKTTDLVFYSAWFHLLLHIEEDGTLQQSLNGWRSLIKKIGKGTGKNAPRYKKEARAQMAHCQKAVPAWIMPVGKVFENFEPGINNFDIIIVDEASQSDLSVLAILYMAKKAIIVGDDKQVSPMAIGEDSEKINLLRESYLLQDLPLRTLYDGKTSIYELVRTVYRPLMLKEHFRCVPQIIGYSNNLCYDGKITPLRDAGSSSVSPQIISFRVANGKRKGKQKINDEEAKSIVAILRACIEQPEYQGETFGVISLLGEEQAELIQKYISEQISPIIIEERRILCGTAAQFQGDERNVIFLSMVDSNDKEGPMRKVGSGIEESTMQRYNVAVSRARDQLWIVHSLDYKTDLQAGDIRRDFLEYADNPDAAIGASAQIERLSESPFEKSVGQSLVAMGYDIVPQWHVGIYRIDMVARYGENKVAIECDGDRYHSGEENLRRDMERQIILERVGWRFIRIRGSEYYSDPDKAINRIVSELNKMGIYKQISEENTHNTARHSDLKATIINRAAQIVAEWEEQPHADQVLGADRDKTSLVVSADDAVKPSEHQTISTKKKEIQTTGLDDDIEPHYTEMQADMTKNEDVMPSAKEAEYTNKDRGSDTTHSADITKDTEAKDTQSERRQTANQVRNKPKAEAANKPPQNNDRQRKLFNEKDAFIASLKKNGIGLIDNSEHSGIIWVLYKNDMQTFVEEAAAKEGFSCKLYKRGSEATNRQPAWMILIQ